MPSGQRSWRTSAKHLASSNSPERLTRSDAGMIARAPCMKTAAAHHPIRSLARRLLAPLPRITRKPTRAIAQTIAAHAPLTLRATKEAVRRITSALAADVKGDDLVLMCYMSADFREGLEAFLA